jgi:CrcB protein
MTPSVRSAQAGVFLCLHLWLADYREAIVTTVLIIFFGAGIGGTLRHFMNDWITRAVGSDFPWGIMAVNILGCFVMGVVVGWFAFRGQASQELRLFLTTGVLGGFTTFSSFALDAVLLGERGQLVSASLYVMASVIVAIGALMIAMLLIKLTT